APQGKHWLERWAARCSPDLVIANSRFTARAGARMFPDAPRAVHYPFSVPPAVSTGEARGRVRASPGAAETDLAILTAARVDPYKGHLRLADALGLLREVPRWVLWMAGGTSVPEEQTHLERVLARARDAGVTGRMRYLGHRGDVPELFAAADIYCQ